MARTNVNFEDNRRELIKKIWHIFLEHGYEKVTVSLMIRELNISKGGFYHYFSSKEECLDAVVELYAEKFAKQVASGIKDNLSADKKLQQLILAGYKMHDKDSSYESINVKENLIFHEKFMVALIKAFAPIYGAVIDQGINEGIFNVEYPYETAEMLLTLSQFYFDKDLFKWSDRELKNRIVASGSIFAKILGTELNIFNG